MKKVTVERNGDIVPVEAILQKVEENGLCILPEFIGGDQLAQLNKEFEAIISADELAGVHPMELNAGNGVDVHLYDLGDAYPCMQEFFQSSWMQSVSDAYWEAPAKLNDHIFVMQEVQGTEHTAQDLHFDVQKTCKFFLYLNDVTSVNGAFSCVPGSHRRTKDVREELGDQISYERRELTRDHPYSEEEIIPIEGKAGTLIVFTTEVWHRAGKVSQGERRVMRGHTRLAEVVPTKKAAGSKKKVVREAEGKGGIFRRILKRLGR